jgi:hypothetical protein
LDAVAKVLDQVSLCGAPCHVGFLSDHASLEQKHNQPVDDEDRPKDMDDWISPDSAKFRRQVSRINAFPSNVFFMACVCVCFHDCPEERQDLAWNVAG